MSDAKRTTTNPVPASGSIRLVATDADGTLLDPSSMVSDRTRRVLDQVRAKGIEVVVATGRPIDITGEILAAAGIENYAVCSNGAVTVDVRSGNRLRVELVDADPVRSFLERARAAIDGVGFAVEMERRVVHESGFAGQVVEVPTAAGLVEDATTHLTEPVEKALVFHATIDAHTLLRLCRDIIAADPSFAGLEATRSGLAFVEVGARGVSKATALSDLCNDLGIDAAEVVAFGDELNDLEMLAWAGTGVAMANADPEIIRRADTVTSSNAADGVASWLETHVL